MATLHQADTWIVESVAYFFVSFRQFCCCARGNLAVATGQTCGLIQTGIYLPGLASASLKERQRVLIDSGLWFSRPHTSEVNVTKGFCYWHSELLVCHTRHETFSIVVCRITKVLLSLYWTPSHEVITPASEEGEWSVSFRFLPLCCGEGAPGTHWISGWLKKPSPGLGCNPVIQSVPHHLISLMYRVSTLEVYKNKCLYFCTWKIYEIYFFSIVTQKVFYARHYTSMWAPVVARQISKRF
jgi:hypothetical protein